MPTLLKNDSDKPEPPVENWSGWLSSHGYPGATFSKYMPGAKENTGMLEIYKKGSTAPTYLEVGPSQFKEMQELIPEAEPEEQKDPYAFSDVEVLLQSLPMIKKDKYGRTTMLRHPAASEKVDTVLREATGLGLERGFEMLRDQWESASPEKKKMLMESYDFERSKRNNPE